MSTSFKEVILIIVSFSHSLVEVNVWLSYIEKPADFSYSFRSICTLALGGRKGLAPICGPFSTPCPLGQRSGLELSISTALLSLKNLASGCRCSFLFISGLFLLEKAQPSLWPLSFPWNTGPSHGRDPVTHLTWRGVGSWTSSALSLFRINGHTLVLIFLQ